MRILEFKDDRANEKYANPGLSHRRHYESTVYYSRRSPAGSGSEPQQVLPDHPRSEQRTEKHGLSHDFRQMPDSVLQAEVLWSGNRR